MDVMFSIKGIKNIQLSAGQSGRLFLWRFPALYSAPDCGSALNADPEGKVFPVLSVS
jgi:hypothetical protein